MNIDISEILYLSNYKSYRHQIFTQERPMDTDIKTSVGWATALWFPRYSQPWICKILVLCRNISDVNNFVVSWSFTFIFWHKIDITPGFLSANFRCWGLFRFGVINV